MFGLTPGEFGLAASITIAIVTARYFPALGERIAVLLLARPAPPEPDGSTPPPPGTPPA